jgi:hypothetical protein
MAIPQRAEIFAPPTLRNHPFPSINARSRSISLVLGILGVVIVTMRRSLDFTLHLFPTGSAARSGLTPRRVEQVADAPNQPEQEEVGKPQQRY